METHDDDSSRLLSQAFHALFSGNFSNLFYHYAASLHIEYPMLFEVHNAAAERTSHCGVLEFIAEEGMIYMPYWVWTCLE